MSDLKRITVTATAVLPTEMTDDQLGIAPSAHERIINMLTSIGLTEVEVRVEGRT